MHLNFIAVNKNIYHDKSQAICLNIDEPTDYCKIVGMVKKVIIKNNLTLDIGLSLDELASEYIEMSCEYTNDDGSSIWCSKCLLLTGELYYNHDYNKLILDRYEILKKQFCKNINEYSNSVYYDLVKKLPYKITESDIIKFKQDIEKLEKNKHYEDTMKFVQFLDKWPGDCYNIMNI